MKINTDVGRVIVKNGKYAAEVEKVRQTLIVSTLRKYNGDINKCADILGVTYNTVIKRAHKANFKLEDMRHYNSGRR